VVATIATIGIHGRDYNLPQLQSDSVQERLRRRLNNIRYGREADVFGWNYIVED
jgi:branched-chain amino acid aminotransferase